MCSCLWLSWIWKLWIFFFFVLFDCNGNFWEILKEIQESCSLSPLCSDFKFSYEMTLLKYPKRFYASKSCIVILYYFIFNDCLILATNQRSCQKKKVLINLLFLLEFSGHRKMWYWSGWGFCRCLVEKQRGNIFCTLVLNYISFKLYSLHVFELSTQK